MASMTMAASFLGGSAAGTTKQLPTIARRRGVVVARASKESDNLAKEESNINTRRDLMFALAAAAACSVANVAIADEPKRGTPEAKKKYAPICVTMPTARICRN
ncbi:hypothetical protein ACJIZ3_012016 [Penstemon smallii]|uniref:Photosystem II 5 kDa protein, chloroplastic n=1 Tax=Penstemon smallii TaxID=265156 RepID=A0ABD3UKT1_9LAMI